MFKLYFLIPLLVPLALARRERFWDIFRKVERWAGRLARNPARAVAVVGCFSLALSMILSLAAGRPVPQVHDEFGYLLLGDTFAHGRVTNPTPPLWQHFETLHEIMQPTYTAKYPPAQGVVLAVGELLGGPIIGIWIATALACAAICWMFMGWMPVRWALWGGLLVAMHPLILEWSQDYWGGSVAMGGGALILGAFRRLLREPRPRDAALMGLGLGVLANSRPYEGFVLGTMMLLALLVCVVVVHKVPFVVLFRRLFCPMAAVLILFAGQICFYNWRVTGKPLVMPYMVHEDTYGLAPLFLFGTPRSEPAYRHREIRELQESYLAYFRSQRRSLGAMARATGEKIWTLGQGYLWSWLLAVALLGLPWALKRDRWLWLALLIGLFFSISMLMGTWVFPHYAAPAAGLFFVVVVESIRSLNTWHKGTWRPGRNIVRGLGLLGVISFFQVWGKMAAHGHDQGLWYIKREAILARLRSEPGKSLVIVKYEPDHNPNREWVYNAADLDHTKVILARDMGTEKNKELLDYYRDRKPWVVDADAPQPEAEPYSGS